MSSEDVDDGLMTGGAPIFKFDRPGATIKGTVENVEKTQQTDFQTKKKAFYPDGNPKWQWVITLLTELRTGKDDDGRRRIFVKSGILRAVKDAIRRSGLEHGRSTRGGILEVNYWKNEPSQIGNSPKKVYRARFTPGVALAETWDGDDDDAPEPGSDVDERGGGNDGDNW